MKYDFKVGNKYKIRIRNCQGANNEEGEIVTCKTSYKGDWDEQSITVRSDKGRDWAFKSYNLLPVEVTFEELNKNKAELEDELNHIVESINFMKENKLKVFDKANFKAFKLLEVASNPNYSKDQKIDEIKYWLDSE